MGLVGGRKQRPWLTAQTAQMIAISRRLGLADAIDSMCEFENRTITPGDTFELMLGAIASRPEHVALSSIRSFYDGAPLEALLGKPVEPENLNAMALARNLDVIGNVPDKETLMWELSRKAESMYGLESNVLHGDGTCFKFTGDPKDDVFEEHIAVPKHGHPKIAGYGKYLQYNAYGIADGSRVLRTTRPYDGNVSDPVMNRDALEFLDRVEDPKRLVFVADCKLASAGLLDRMDAMGIGYVTKLADNTIDDGRDKALMVALPELYLDEDDGHIRRFADVTVEFHGKKRRTVVVTNIVRYREMLKKLRTKIFSDLEAKVGKLSKMQFESEATALETARSKLNAKNLSGFKVTYRTVDKRVRKRPHQGPDAKDEEYRTVYSLEIQLERDSDSIRILALSEASAVLITNLGRSPSEDGDVRKGADAEMVNRLYNGQFVCEHAYRLMKSGLGLDSIYLQNPRRVDGMLFVVSLVAMMFTLIDAVLRGRDLKKGATVYRMKVEFLTSLMINVGDDWEFEGPPEKLDMFMERLSILSVDPESFLRPRNA